MKDSESDRDTILHEGIEITKTANGKFKITWEGNDYYFDTEDEARKWITREVAKKQNRPVTPARKSDSPGTPGPSI